MTPVAADLNSVKQVGFSLVCILMYLHPMCMYAYIFRYSLYDTKTENSHSAENPKFSSCCFCFCDTHGVFSKAVFSMSTE